MMTGMGRQDCCGVAARGASELELLPPARDLFSLRPMMRHQCLGALNRGLKLYISSNSNRSISIETGP